MIEVSEESTYRWTQDRKDAYCYEGSCESSDGWVLSVGNDESPAENWKNSWKDISDECIRVVFGGGEGGSSDIEFSTKAIDKAQSNLHEQQ